MTSLLSPVQSNHFTLRQQPDRFTYYYNLDYRTSSEMQSMQTGNPSGPLPDVESNSYIISNRGEYFNPFIEANRDLLSRCTPGDSSGVSNEQSKVKTRRVFGGEDLLCGRPPETHLFRIFSIGLPFDNGVWGAYTHELKGSLHLRNSQAQDTSSVSVDEYPIYTVKYTSAPGAPTSSFDVHLVSLCEDCRGGKYTALFEPTALKHNELVVGLMNEALKNYYWVTEEQRKRGYQNGTAAALGLKVEFKVGKGTAWLSNPSEPLVFDDAIASFGYVPSCATRERVPYAGDEDNPYVSIRAFIESQLSDRRVASV